MKVYLPFLFWHFQNSNVSADMVIPDSENTDSRSTEPILGVLCPLCHLKDSMASFPPTACPFKNGPIHILFAIISIC